MRARRLITAILTLAATGQAASAAELTLTSNIGPAQTVFAGKPQATVVQVSGCSAALPCPARVELAPGREITVATNMLSIRTGQHDGKPTGPRQTVNIPSVLLINGHLLPVHQIVTIEQIGNDQFMAQLSEQTASISVPGVGEVSVRSLPAASQFLSNTTPSMIMRTTFRLVAAQP
jgi:hypothetical protein